MTQFGRCLLLYLLACMLPRLNLPKDQMKRLWIESFVKIYWFDSSELFISGFSALTLVYRSNQMQMLVRKTLHRDAQN